MTDNTAGKSIIITGAASGFGKLLAGKAAARGAKVTCADVNTDALDDAVVAIRKAGGCAQAVRADVTSMDDMRALAQCAVDTYGGLE